METEKLVRNTTLLLCFAAGFCDTLTFVAAGELFSAHVTGNFIVFAYDLIKHNNPHDWQKLLTFPVFVLAVMLGGRIGKKSANMYLLLILESLLLIISGLLSATLLDQGQEGGWQVQIIVVLIVIAMAFQNTFGKLYNKATYGLTTVMTGNVTQASLDLIRGLTINPADNEIWVSFRKQLVLIVGFLVGCLSGAVMAKQFGLVSVLVPGLLMVMWLAASKLLKQPKA
ncbi:YoaK family protein [Mucilaginibacter sp. AW1-7]|uniref:YoaK family protein n=1 Tax=Mucilaginibacter sp. AW1-7 TaxID=3349874 RepID=UPI003F73CD2A